MAIAFRKAPEQRQVERNHRTRIDRVDAVFFVDHAALENAPASLALFHPVEEAAVARRVDLGTVELRTDHDGHAGLGDRASAVDLRGGPAEKMLRARSLAPRGLAGFDEVIESPVEPGGGHGRVRVRGRAQLLPVARVARERPALRERGDGKLILKVRAHSGVMPARRRSPVHLATSARTNGSVSAGAMRRLRPLPISSRERTSAERVALSTSARRRSTISRGVRAGANRPNHVSISRSSTPVSMIVGTCGMFGARARLDTASALTCPDST